MWSTFTVLILGFLFIKQPILGWGWTVKLSDSVYPTDIASFCFTTLDKGKPQRPKYDASCSSSCNSHTRINEVFTVHAPDPNSMKLILCLHTYYLLLFLYYFLSLNHELLNISELILSASRWRVWWIYGLTVNQCLLVKTVRSVWWWTHSDS